MVFQDMNTITLYVFIINYCLEVEIPQIDGAANIENFKSQLIFLCKIIGTHAMK